MNVWSLMRRSMLVTATAVVGVIWSAAAFADTGGLQIRVVDADGNPVAGAQINASTSESLTRRSGVTDAQGELRLMGLDPSDDYTVTVTAQGYQAARNEGTLVVTERVFNLPFVLAKADEALEEIITYGRSDVGQLVDTTSSMQATDVTLDIMESLPTGRNYQSYLQMAPTTKPTLDEVGNPSSKSGVNWADNSDAQGNVAGSSTDNIYYIDGINITDNNNGEFGANFNSEIIQEQQIITGGVPAEYEGGQGLVSRVITKSGGNEFHGSVNYYMQSDSLVADNKHLDEAGFSDFDTAFTLGGPIIKDQLWFFGSWQRKEREEDVVDPNTQELQRKVTRTQDFGFLKLTYQPTENDKLVAEWFNDPGDRDGSFDTLTLGNRDEALEDGGDNFKFEYSHAWDNVIVTANWMRHEGEYSRVPADPTVRNDVAFTDATKTNADRDLGGLGFSDIRNKNKESINLALEWFVDAGPGSHDIKFGYSDMTNEFDRETLYNGNPRALWTSIGTADSGTTLDEYTGGGWNGEIDISGDDYNRILDAMNDSPTYLALYDANDDGTISGTELGDGLVFDSTTGNPNGAVNVYRIWMSETGAQTFETQGQAFYAQDSWNIDEHWTINAGIRAEKWDHYASDAKTKIFTFDWEYAPRLSVVYDLKGDGASKVWAFYGRYYDPIRTNMTNFAGAFTGAVREEQVYTNADEWLTFRTRGGTTTLDAFFAPNTKTPYTDEILLGWEQSLTPNQSISVTYTDRKTRDILEDFDLGLYNCDGGDLAGTDFCLPLSYFGFPVAPAANYHIATLAGGKRDYQGYEVSWRKRRSADSNWFGLASLVYNDAEGNTNSDSNADFQGDVVWLDPRAPYQYSKLPGNIEWLFKAAGSYAFENGLEIGATYRWNSGIRYSRTFEAYGRHLPERVADAYEFGGFTTRWLAPDSVGGYEGSSYGIVDARVKYVMEFGQSMQAEFFLDIFNVLDNQAGVIYTDLDAGSGPYSFGEPYIFERPRRFYLGARFSF